MLVADCIDGRSWIWWWWWWWCVTSSSDHHISSAVLRSTLFYKTAGGSCPITPICIDLSLFLHLYTSEFPSLTQPACHFVFQLTLPCSSHAQERILYAKECWGWEKAWDFPGRNNEALIQSDRVIKVKSLRWLRMIYLCRRKHPPQPLIEIIHYYAQSLTNHLCMARSNLLRTHHFLLLLLQDTHLCQSYIMEMWAR